MVVVDAPNLRVEDIKPYWAVGQVLRMPTDPLRPNESVASH